MSGVAVVLLLAGAVGILTSPATTRQGVNFLVLTRETPFYVKILDFLHRHYQYRAIAHEITEGLRSDEERVLAVFAWTRRNIRGTPEGWAVVDDHVLNIIIRGHGLDDQMADVFTTLATYAGVPAYWRVLRLRNAWEKLVLSFARIEGRWKVFDVTHGLVFRNARGELADIEELVSNPGLVTATAGELRPLGVPYVGYIAQLGSGAVPAPLRAELHMPGPRLRYEVRRLVGW